VIMRRSESNEGWDFRRWKDLKALL
jgi:hypothetical protein